MEGHRWRKDCLLPERPEETTSPGKVFGVERSRSSRRPERRDERVRFDSTGRAGQKGQRPRDRAMVAPAVGASYALRSCALLPNAAGRVLRSTPGRAHRQTGDAHAHQSDADQKDQRAGNPSLMVTGCTTHVSGGEQEPRLPVNGTARGPGQPCPSVNSNVSIRKPPTNGWCVMALPYTSPARGQVSAPKSL